MNRALFIFLLVLLTGCATTVKPSKPPAGSFDQPLDPVSKIYLPASFEVDRLEELINENIPRGKVDGGGNRQSHSLSYTYEVHLNGRTTVAAHNGFLQLKIPVSASAKGTKIICGGFWHNGRCRGVKTSEHATVSTSATGIVDVRVNISPDYTVSVDPSVNFKMNGKTHLKMDLFGSAIRINIDITPKIQGILDKQAPKLASTLKEKIGEIVNETNLKLEVESQWVAASKGIEAGDAWIQFKPSKVIFRGIHSDQSGEKAQLGLGFEGPVNVSLTKPSQHSLPLPPVETVEITDPVFKVNIPFYSAFQDLENKINEDLAGYIYEKDNYHLKIKGVDLNGVLIDDQPALLIGVNFTGRRDVRWYDIFLRRVKGVLYFTAFPEIDVANQRISIRDFELTSETSSLLFDKGLQWILQLNKDNISNKLSKDLKPEIERVKTEMNARLVEGQLVGPIIIQGEIEELGLEGFYLDNNEIEIYSKATGKVRAEYAPQ